MQFSDLNQRSIFTGVLITLIGMFVIFEGLGFRMGSARSMGPGYFPTILGILMVGFGLLIAITELHRKKLPIKPSYRAFIMVVMAIIAFSFMIVPFGIVPTVFATVYLSSLADPKSKIKTSFYISLFMSVLVIVVFKFGLGFQASIIGFGDYWRFGE